MQNKTPYKLLLHQQNQSPNHYNKKRSEEQIQILSELVINSNIFEFYQLSKQYTHQICEKMVLIYADHPHINTPNDNEIYLILDGKAFEYMHNRSTSLKAKIHQNDDYIMVRKLAINDFCTEFSPPRKYSAANKDKKYQLMIDQNTLIGKISGDLFHKIFLPAIQNNWRKINIFSKKVNILNTLPTVMIYELSKYFKQQSYSKGKFIIRKEQKSQYVYFIQSGEVQYRIFNKINDRQSPNKNYKTTYSKNFQRQILRQYDTFGMDTFNPTTYEQVQTDYSAQTRQPALLYKIDKRILAIVISSFDQIFTTTTNKKYSSINLNDQIKGQGYQNQDLQILTRNVEMIKTSQRKIRDIKLRYLNTSKKSRHKFFQEDYQDEQNGGLLDIKYDSYHSLNSKKHTTPLKFSQTTNFKLNKTNFNTFNNTFRSLKNTYSPIKMYQVQKPKISQIVLQAYDEKMQGCKKNKIKMGQVVTKQEEPDSKSTKFRVKTPNFLQNRKKSDVCVNIYGKQQGDIIKAYIQKKQKKQMLKKAENVLDQNLQKKSRHKSQVKRIFRNKTSKSQTNLNKKIKPLLSDGQKKTLGEQLYDRMNKIHENPLLSKIQSERRKLQFNTKLSQRKIKQQKLPTTNRQTRKSNGLILITNN